MARPSKVGIDYFSMDVYNDDKLKLLIAEFGMIGFGVVISLFQKIYGEEGYYTVLNDDVVKLFAHEKNAGYSAVLEIIKCCLRVGIFDKAMYDQYQILTSNGIQKRYVEATSRRVKSCFDPRYILLNIQQNDIYVDNNLVNANNNAVNVIGNTQSKVKKSKVKKSKVIKNVQGFEDFWKAYPRKVKKSVAETSYNKINPDETLLSCILHKLELFKRSKEWKDSQFIPHPSTWLNQRRWEDEIEGGSYGSKTNQSPNDNYGVTRL